MKKSTQSAGRVSLTLLAGATLCFSAFFAGCGQADIDKPLDRTPNVPPSTRGPGGGMPGGPDDIGKDKKSSSYTPAIKIVQGQC